MIVDLAGSAGVLVVVLVGGWWALTIFTMYRSEEEPMNEAPC